MQQLPLKVHPAIHVLADGKKYHQTQAGEVEFLTLRATKNLPRPAGETFRFHNKSTSRS
jgi:hypothetical protein